MLTPDEAAKIKILAQVMGIQYMARTRAVFQLNEGDPQTVATYHSMKEAAKNARLDLETYLASLTQE